jgi:hypothetical protein
MPSTSPELDLPPEDLRNNKLLDRDRAFHDWYRFVLSYPPHLVRHYIDKFELDQRAVILDPFCGTGTTIVEAKKNGIASIGVEAIPMSHFVCGTKVQWSVDVEALRTLRDRVLENANTRVDRAPFLGFNPEQSAIISHNAIAPVPLHKCLVLQGAIAQEPQSPERNILQLALAYVAVNDASNLKFGPEVGIRRKKREDAPVFDQWLEKVTQMAADLTEFQPLARVPAHCRRGDSRTLRTLLEPNSIDAVITSPPYPNEKDYTRTTRLESVLLGFLSNKDDLRTFKQSLIRSNTRNVYKIDDDDLLLSPDSQINKIAQEIERKRIALNKNSGFEKQYHRVTKLYFGGMKRHLLDLQEVLRPGATLAYVVGDQASFLQVLIRTGELLAEIARELGYCVIDIDLFRTRTATATGAQLREEVVVLRWPGKPAWVNRCPGSIEPI